MTAASAAQNPNYRKLSIVEAGRLSRKTGAGWFPL